VLVRRNDLPRHLARTETGPQAGMNNLGVIPWPAEAIWEQVAPILPGFTVEVLPEIDSTNTELMRRAKAGQNEPTLLVAEKQTAGRGRLGREWHTLADRAADTLPALTFSLGMPLSPPEWTGLSLAVGVSVAQSLHPDIRLKWPNDLWLSDPRSERKLAGILIETCALDKQRYVVIGVGINITEPPSNPATQLPALRTPAAWLQELLPQSNAPEVLLRIAFPLIQTLLTFEELGFAPFQARFNRLDVLRDRQVSVENGQAPAPAHTQTQTHVRTTGVARGVNDKGELTLQTALGTETINSSEVSVKPL
jgi:BirA family transcriptional regulator, biotin operon repressor / biotin---[acetyl-CoA-carboxylase] ligase